MIYELPEDGQNLLNSGNLCLSQKSFHIWGVMVYDASVSETKLNNLLKTPLFRYVLFTALVAAVAVFLYAEGSAKDIAADLYKKQKTVSLEPHRAVYDIQLHSVKSASKVINVNGQMLYSLQQTCDGYLANHRFNLLYEYTDTPGMHITSDFANFESLEEDKLEFFSTRSRDGKLFEEYSGKASLDMNGSGIAYFERPVSKEYKLPKDTLLPNQHTLAIIKAAKEGKKFLTATIFDGSDEAGPLLANAFILDTGTPVYPVNASIQSSEGEINSKLLETNSWKVRLAFFPLESDLSEPDYEMTVRLHENGVISDMFVEYTDFSVTQKLVAIEGNEQPECKVNDG